jgi:hypothetical protein
MPASFPGTLGGQQKSDGSEHAQSPRDGNNTGAVLSIIGQDEASSSRGSAWLKRYNNDAEQALSTRPGVVVGPVRRWRKNNTMAGNR